LAEVALAEIGNAQWPMPIPQQRAMPVIRRTADPLE
jgi:hypothetical protein